MAHYIDKSTLVAEITRRIKEYNSLANAAADNNLHNTLEANELLIRSYKNLMSFLDTLEVKEVDLEKIIEQTYHDRSVTDTADMDHVTYENIAKHFFELGMIVSNPLTWEDIRLIAEIGDKFMNSEESDNLSEEYYYKEILKRFKTQKGK